MINTEMIFILIVLSTMIRESLGNCVSDDGMTRPANSTWIDSRGYTCTCIKLDDMTFEQCNKNPIEKISSISNKGICKYKGFNYSENEFWMSSESLCAQCSCQNDGQTSCVSDKHCSNTCSQMQSPKYGPCCEVLQCSENGPTFQEDIKCWDSFNNVNVIHGKYSIKQERCIDKFCVCYHGRWVCHNYCQLETRNLSLAYWNKLCCPRPIGKQPCIFNNTTLQPGEKAYLKDLMDNCTCLNEIFYCDRNVTLNSENNRITAVSTKPSDSLPMLIALLSLIGFILSCFIVIVICSNMDKYKQKILHKEKPTEMICLTDNNQDNNSNIKESSIAEI